jgi:23S rRNA pseudouridine2604 synthase
VSGRLDQDSRGLLIFTQNGAFAKQLIGEQNIPKEYIVKVTPSHGSWQDIDHDLIAKDIGLGMQIKDGIQLRPAEAIWKDIDVLSITLLEGKKRQIRHMCNALGLSVVNLQRVRIGNLHLGDLPEGKWRLITPNEVR